MDENKITRYFWMWLIGRTLLWTVAIATILPNGPLDLIEWTSWGHQWQWTYPKHPPFPGWVAAVFAQASPGDIWGVYIAAYLTCGVTILAVWTLAKELLPPRQAFLACLAMDGILFLTHDTAEFSNNVVLNAGWAWTITCCYFVWKTNRWRWWLGLGVTIGLMLLTKYTIAVLILPLLAFLALRPSGRQGFRRPGFWVALALALLISAPHFIVEIQSGFKTLTYANERSTDEIPKRFGRITNPLTFIGGQLGLYVLPMCLILLPLTWRSLFRIDDRRTRHPDLAFVNMAIWGPVGLIIGLSVLTGAMLRQIWGSPLWLFIGVWILLTYRPSDHPGRSRNAVRSWAVIAGLIFSFSLVKYAYEPHWKGSGTRVHFPGKAMARELDRRYRERYGKPIAIVAGEGWRAELMACYAPSKPVLYSNGAMYRIEMDSRACPWVSDEELLRRGGIIVWDPEPYEQHGMDPMEELRKRFPGLGMPEDLEMPYETGANIPRARIRYLLIEGLGK